MLVSDGRLSEAEYIEQLKRIQNEALALSVDTAALRFELQPESLRRDEDLSNLLHYLDWDLQEASDQARRVLKRVEVLLAMQGFPLDPRDQIERDT